MKIFNVEISAVSITLMFKATSFIEFSLASIKKDFFIFTFYAFLILYTLME